MRPLPVVLALLSCAPLAARQDSATPLDERIDALFAEWDAPDTPGASVALLVDGQIVHAAGYGCAQLEYGVPIEADTPFHVASVSKQFTAMVAVLLELDGQLSLDDEVRTHVPEVPDFGAPITLHHLATHTSGLRDQWESLAIAGWRLDDVITTDQVLRLVARQRALNFAPGSAQLYCNTGFTLLAVCAERVTGRAFADLGHELVFEPAGMHDTHVHDDHTRVVPGRAYSYERRDDGFANCVLSYATAGPTSLFTTAPDLCRWILALEEGRVGGADALARLREPAVLTDGAVTRFGLGVVVGSLRGWSTLSHSGGDAGFRSHLVWAPDARVAVAVCSNLADFPATELANGVAALALEGRTPPPAVEPDGAAAAPRAEDPPAEARPEVAPELLESAPARYVRSNGYSAELTRRGSRLYVALAGGSKRSLRPRDDGTFDLVGADGVELLADGAGAVTGLAITRDGRRYAFARDASDEPPVLDVAELVGVYESDELATSYAIVEEDGRAVARHFRHGSIGLEPSWPDQFAGEAWFLPRLQFTRDAEGVVDGFLVQGNRVRDLRFVLRAD